MHINTVLKFFLHSLAFVCMSFSSSLEHHHASKQSQQAGCYSVSIFTPDVFRIKAVTCSLAVVMLLLNFTWKHLESFMQQYSCFPRSCRSLSPTPTPTLPRLSNSAADCRVATKRWGLSGRPLMFKKKTQAGSAFFGKKSFIKLLSLYFSTQINVIVCIVISKSHIYIHRIVSCFISEEHTEPKPASSTKKDI